LDTSQVAIAKFAHVWVAEKSANNVLRAFLLSYLMYRGHQRKGSWSDQICQCTANSPSTLRIIVKMSVLMEYLRTSGE